MTNVEAEYKRYILDLLEKHSWKVIKGSDLDKKSEDYIIRKIFFEKVKEINEEEGIILTDKDLNELLYKISVADESDILRYLKNGVDLFLEKYNYKNIVKLIDFEKMERNDFLAVEEVVFKKGHKKIRADIVLFVNGIPLAIIEVQKRESDEWKKGFNQLINYCRDIPDLFKIIQIGYIFADNVLYLPFDEEIRRKINTDLLESKLYKWKPDENRKVSDPDTIAKVTIQEMLKPENFLEILKYFTFYRKKRKVKILPRYYQYYTVKKLLEKIYKRLEGISKEHSWTIWHYQGSGKTLTMIYLMYSILKRIKNISPIILFVVDRKELEEQILNDFLGDLDLDLDIEPKKIESFNELEEIVKNIDKITRGVYVILIQKFRELPEHVHKSSREKDVFIFIDEAHRSHYGILSERLFEMFSNAFYFAFTGTPLILKDRNTFRRFGDPIDIYFIDEAESDGYVVPIYYKAMFDIVKLELRKIYGENFESIYDRYNEVLINVLEGEIDEGLEDDENVDNRLLSVRKLFFENERRIEYISNLIAKHFKKEVEPNGYKALLIVASRKAAILYKKYLSKYFDEGDVEVVITYQGREDNPEVKEFAESMIKRYGGFIKNYDEINKKIVERFKKRNKPKILIVVNKLITGFDEPKIQTIYIDRFMSYHTLLQAIGRCNRRLNNIKKNGLIVDFVGIIDIFKEALELYFGTRSIYRKSKEIGIIIRDIKQLEFTINDILKQLEENVFKKIGYSMEEILKTYELYKNDEKKLEEFLDEIILELVLSGLSGTFKKYFKELELNIISPVYSELKQQYKDINKIDKFYEILRIIYDVLSHYTEDLEDSYTNPKLEKIVNKIRSIITVKEILESHKRRIEELERIINSSNYELLEKTVENILSNISSKEDKNYIAMLIKVLKILEGKRARLRYKSIISKILKKIEEWNRMKYDKYKLLEEISIDIESILNFERMYLKNKIDEDVINLYIILSEVIPLRISDLDYKNKILSISKELRDKIREIEIKYRESNDFCLKLARTIRIVLLKEFKNLKLDNKNLLNEATYKVKRFYAEKYEVCQDILIG